MRDEREPAKLERTVRRIIIQNQRFDAKRAKWARYNSCIIVMSVMATQIIAISFVLENAIDQLINERQFFDWDAYEEKGGSY